MLEPVQQARRHMVLKMSSKATNILLAGAVALGVMSIIAWDEYASWQTAVARVEQHLIQVADGVSEHIDDTLDVAGLALADLIVEISDGTASAGTAKKLQTLMKSQVEITHRLASLSVLDKQGRLLVSSSDTAPIGTDFSDRDYFRHHLMTPATGIYVGMPVKSRVSGSWIVTVSRRLEQPGSGFSGVVIATIPVDYFTNYFARFETGTRGTFLLAHSNGVVLARAPLAGEILGRDISKGELFTRHIANSFEGIYNFVSPIDGEDMIGAYHKSARSGLVVLASASRVETLSTWGRVAHIRWTSLGVVLLIAVFSLWRWRLQDVRRQASERRLAAREAEFRLLAENSADLIQRLGWDGTRHYVSPASRLLFEVSPDDLRGTSVFEGLDEENTARLKDVFERLKAGSKSEKLIIRRDLPGKSIWIETTFSHAANSATSSETGIITVTRDVTRQKNVQDELLAIASTDSLTGLANRRVFDERLANLIRQGNNGASLSLIMIDIDRFKLYNDTYGHHEGDLCLRAVAKAVSSCVTRSTDIVARFGGEEIVVLLPGTDAAGASALAETIRGRVEDLGIEHRANEPWGKVTISLGCGSADTDQARRSDIFDRADQALYKAKNRGRNRVEVLSAGEQPASAAKLPN